MTGLILIIAVAVWVMMYRPSIDGTRDLPVKISEKLDQLWSIAQESIRENKYLRAEKALLTILRVDEKNLLRTTDLVSCTLNSAPTRTR